MRKTELSGWNFSNEDRTPVASISLIEHEDEHHLVAACRAAPCARSKGSLALPAQDFPGCPDDQTGSAGIVNPKNGSVSPDTGNDAGDRTGIAIFWIGEVQYLADHGFARHGEKNRPIESRQSRQLTKNRQVIIPLLGEINSRIDQDGFAGHARLLSQFQFLFKKSFHG